MNVVYREINISLDIVSIDKYEINMMNVGFCFLSYTCCENETRKSMGHPLSGCASVGTGIEE